MCGIVGYVGRARADELLYAGLRRLEYRGYDSAGIAVPASGGFRVARVVGTVKGLEGKLGFPGTSGLGHTRWATHGKPSERNAHPIASCDGKVVVIHNGIIENHKQLRAELEGKGHRFATETDTEVAAHLVEDAYRRAKDLEAALVSVVERLQGSYALAVMHADAPDMIGAARIASPLVLGIGKGENFLASDVTAFLDRTRSVVFLEDGELASLTPERVRVFDRTGKTIRRSAQQISWSLEDAERGGYEHFMLKEIMETPRAIREALVGRVPALLEGELDLEGSWPDGAWVDADRLLILACGSSYHASLAGKRMFESLASLPVEAEIASEFRLSPELPISVSLALAITQSGETADTLAAMKKAKAQGYRLMSLANVVGSTATRLADATMLLRAGPEVSVAATKSFTNQLVSLVMLAVLAGRERKRLGAQEAKRVVTELRALPSLVQTVLDDSELIKKQCKPIARARSCFTIGRGMSHAIALEAALKIKEVSYVHAEGFPAGELKHGPLALLAADTPVLALVPPDESRNLMLTNIGEVRARDAPVIAVCEEGDREAVQSADAAIEIPRSDPILFPMAANVALQLVAYHTARMLKRPIDRPRNLAKSVTVE